MQLIFSICSWGAWSPQYQLASDWQNWQETGSDHDSDLPGAPKLAQVPAMQRRRYSALTKMQLEAAFQCDAPQQCRTIFSSRHGELNRTLGLLDNVVNQEALSPTAFSQSVHNTASGIYSILKGNRASSTSIAAGSETLYQALVEAYAQLHEDPTPLLLVFGDEPVPQVYSQFTDEPELPLSMAFVLTLATPEPGQPQLTIGNITSADDVSYGEILHSLATNQPLSGTLSKHHWQLNFG
ncbi:beta-ketoacyl synthase chain length factor [Shewanella atlantica]|uniref:3-oxoacyl-ACP synthase n=1 Tax=Shewanella atlantica TaxID=271099 RepID=A0A3S0L8D7_9GAMM|nr:beta-ketoacyl synthase chain length factor [Shewanella atlantica]RTR29323.1 3-oxoacyl-ACP synthase [Shewanella atlantica]